MQRGQAAWGYRRIDALGLEGFRKETKLVYNVFALFHDGFG